jgi:two-component system NtrC family sensor kinase
MAETQRWSDATSDRLIQALLDISNLVGSVMRLEDILDRIVAIASQLMGVPSCSIYLLNGHERTLVLSSSNGLEPELVGQARFAPGEGIPGWVFITGEVMALQDAVRDPRFRPIPGSAMETAYHAYLCVPLRIQEEIVGVVTVRSTEARGFDRRDGLLMETVCKMVAIVIEKARMYHDMIRARELAAVAVSLSGTAHFIKNIMFTTQIAQATIDRVISEREEFELARNAWQSLKESNRQISKLVGNMLNYCREDKPVYEEADINALIRDLAASVQDAARSRNADLILELDARLPRVDLDVDAIRDALLNLVTNSLDALPAGRGGHVWIRTYRLPEQNNFRIEVADDGTGIADNIRDRIFNLFFTTKGEGGSGIGLASTRKIIERHNGTIDAASTPGSGSCFIIHLPLRAVPAALGVADGRLGA